MRGSSYHDIIVQFMILFDEFVTYIFYDYAAYIYIISAIRDFEKYGKIKNRENNRLYSIQHFIGREFQHTYAENGKNTVYQWKYFSLCK